MTVTDSRGVMKPIVRGKLGCSYHVDVATRTVSPPPSLPVSIPACLLLLAEMNEFPALVPQCSPSPSLTLTEGGYVGAAGLYV